MLSDQEFDEIEAVVGTFRERMGVPDDIVLDVSDLLRRMKIAGELGDVLERDPELLGGSAATYEPDLDAIVVPTGMLTKSLSPRDRFTLAHEIGHRLDGHQYVRHRKANSAKQFGRQVKSDEFRANAMAAALLIPERLAKADQSTTAEQLSKQFCVSMQVAERRLLDLQKRDRRRRGLRRPIPQSFDTGIYDEAMPQMARNSRRWNA